MRYEADLGHNPSFPQALHSGAADADVLQKKFAHRFERKVSRDSREHISTIECLHQHGRLPLAELLAEIFRAAKVVVQQIALLYAARPPSNLLPSMNVEREFTGHPRAYE